METGAPVELPMVRPEELDGGGGGQADARERGERREAEEVERAVEGIWVPLMHDGHRPLAPLETVREPEAVDQCPRLVVLGEDVMVVGLDGLAGHADGTRQPAHAGCSLEHDDRATLPAQARRPCPARPSRRR